MKLQKVLNSSYECHYAKLIFLKAAVWDDYNNYLSLEHAMILQISLNTIMYSVSEKNGRVIFSIFIHLKNNLK